MADRDDFSVSSAVSGGGGPVIKVQIGESGQVRRIAAHRVLKEGKPVYDLLSALVLKFASPEKKIPSVGFEVEITYTDEDGDVITISTDEELEDALSMVVDAASSKKQSVLRLKAAVKETDKEDNEEDKTKADAAPSEAKSQPRRLSSFSSTQSKRKLACGSVGKLKWDLLAVGDGDLDAESGEIAEQLVKDIVDSISQSESVSGKTEESEGKKDGAAKAEAEDKPKEEATAPVFIHARHTCDGCGVTPIMGMRYRSTNRDDYDLCQGCFYDPTVGSTDYNNFVTEELDRDRGMQPRWQRRFARGRHGPAHGPAHRGRCHGRHHMHRQMRQMARQARAHQRQQHQHRPARKPAEDAPKEDQDADLQEAVLRSMQETRKVVEEKPAEDIKSTTENTEKTEVNDAKHDKETKSTSTNMEDPSVEWRNIAESFSSTASGSANFAEALGAVASVVASEIESYADSAADKTRSAGDAAAADTEGSAESGQVPNGIASAIAAALNASRVASAVASEVKAAVEKEFKKDDAPADGSDAPVPSAPAAEEEDVTFEEASLWKSHPEAPDAEEEPEIVVPSNEGTESDKAKDEWQEVEAEEKDANKVEVPEGKDAEKEEEEPDDISSSSSIASPVLARWAEQLKVLRQLGFANDHKSVDALETLYAANIGVDSADEVTVGDAVNYLLNNADK